MLCEGPIFLTRKVEVHLNFGFSWKYLVLVLFGQNCVDRKWIV